jgi:branched-chain amino acid transport system permease protein
MGVRSTPSPPPSRSARASQRRPALLGPVFIVYPTMGDLASLKAFAIVILGGLGSIPGATIGGFILAFMEELGAGYVSSGFRDGMGFLLIILILVFKPTGLFAQKERIG